MEKTSFFEERTKGAISSKLCPKNDQNLTGQKIRSPTLHTKNLNRDKAYVYLDCIKNLSLPTQDKKYLTTALYGHKPFLKDKRS
jgi:hypothetical protein